MATNADTDIELLLNDTKTIVSSIVIPNPNGVSLKTLSDDYYELEGKEIPYKELGFNSLTAFIKSMPDMIRMVGLSNGRFTDSNGYSMVTLFPVAMKSTQHIIELVSNQSKKSFKTKKSKRKAILYLNGRKRYSTIASIRRPITRNLISNHTTTRRPTARAQPPIGMSALKSFIRIPKVISQTQPNTSSVRPQENGFSEQNHNSVSPMTRQQSARHESAITPVIALPEPPKPTNYEHNLSLNNISRNSSHFSLNSSASAVAIEPLVTTTPLTLTDWLRQKREDFRPEKRIESFKTKAEQLAEDGNYEEAVVYYSKAIEVAPTDWALHSYRSLCYEKLKNYEQSLSDAQKAIDFSDKWLKQLKKNPETYKYRNKMCFYRKGIALRALNRFQESIDAFVVAKALAIRCPFIDNEIKSIKMEVICELGYNRTEVEAVCDTLDSIDGLVQKLNQNKQLMIDSGDDNLDQLPTNPFRYKGLYVNGLIAELEEQRLSDLLLSCGPIIRCKVYSNPNQSRAVITFEDEQTVCEAIKMIRSHKELIRDESIDNLVISYRHTCVEGGTDPQTQFKDTEIAGECYKWRTTGCLDADCKALHIPICHHLDQQSVETESVKRKRTPIVFDISFDEQLSPKDVKKVKSSNRTPIKFDIDIDIDSDIETEPTKLNSVVPAKKRLGFSDMKLSQTKNKPKPDPKDADVNATPEPLKKVRKYIVFDIKPDSAEKGLTSTPKSVLKVNSCDTLNVKPFVLNCDNYTTISNTSFTDIKPINVGPPAPGLTSYDDLFD